MNEQEYQNLMNQLKESNDQQALYAKKTYKMAVVAAICCLVAVVSIIVAALVVAPKFNRLYREAETSLKNITEISQQLADADLDKLVLEVEGLVNNTQEDLGIAMDAIDQALVGMDTAMKKIEAIDVNELNGAIKNLSDTVEPFAKFFNKFK